MGTEKILSPPLSTHKYRWLAAQLEKLIAHGFKPGDKLPSIRKLAAQYQLSKNTVIQALHELETKGLIEAKPKSGYTVRIQQYVRPPSEPAFNNIQPSKVTVPELLQDVIVRGAAFDIRPTETPTQLPGLMTKLHRNINRSMRSQVTRKSLYYDDPQGQVTLREEISQHYRYRDVQLSADEICITGGCQHSLLLALMATCKAGDNVAIESPGFYGVIQLLDKLGLHAIEIPSHSANGIAVDVLEEVLDKFDVTACVVSPCFSTPSGACMSLEDKRRLIELANQHDLAVIEDDIYGDLSFEQPLAPIKSLDTQERVILCSSFSKSLSRDLRLGWIMAARWQSEIVRLSVLSHIANSQAIQTGLYWFMRDGDYNRYLYQFRHQLLRQKNQMEGALQRFWHNDIRFSHPKGGLSLWVELHHSVDTLKLYTAALPHRILITPGALFSVEQDFSNFMRLSFCHPTEGAREAALQKLQVLSKQQVSNLSFT